jgi:hypothetical protein
MRGFIEQNTSESERSYPVVPEGQSNERSMPSARAVPGRREGRIIYSSEQYETSYSIRLRSTPRER